MATNFPTSVDDFATTSPTNLGDDDSTGRTHPERHNDIESAMEAVQSWVPRDRRWMRGAASNAADDEFRDASLAGAWTRVDASGGSGRATWTESADCLSLYLAGGDAAAELHALVKAHSLAVGDYVETCITGSGMPANYYHAGIILADGTTYTAGTQSYFCFNREATAPSYYASEWSVTGYDTRAASSSLTTTWWQPTYMRTLRHASNGYKFYISPDGVSWVEALSRTLTLTPTHVGFAGGTWGSSSPTAFSFDYLRVGTA